MTDPTPTPTLKRKTESKDSRSLEYRKITELTLNVPEVAHVRYVNL